MKYYFVSPYFCSIRGKVRHSYYSCWRWFVVWVFGEIIERSDWSSKEIVITCYRLFNKGHREGLAYDLISSSLETNSKSVVLDIVTRVTRIIISFLEIREFEYELLLQNLLQRGLLSSESMLRSRPYLLTLLWFEEDVSISFFFHFCLLDFVFGVLNIWHAKLFFSQDSSISDSFLWDFSRFGEVGLSLQPRPFLLFVSWVPKTISIMMPE